MILCSYRKENKKPHGTIIILKEDTTMKNTKMTKKATALLAAAMMIATVSVCASAETDPNRPPEEDTRPVLNIQSEQDEDTSCGAGIHIRLGVRV